MKDWPFDKKEKNLLKKSFFNLENKNSLEETLIVKMGCSQSSDLDHVSHIKIILFLLLQLLNNLTSNLHLLNFLNKSLTSKHI